MNAPFGYRVRTGEPRKSGAKGGRPELLDDKLIGDFVLALQMGSTQRGACDFAGIDSATFYAWLKRGARDRRRKKATKYARFSSAVQKAMGQAKLAHVGTIAEAAKGRAAKLGKDGKVIEAALAPAWQASAWWLERNYPREYARRTYRMEEDRGPVAEQGAVVPYQVRMPEVDPLPPPPKEPHREAEHEPPIEAE